MKKSIIKKVTCTDELPPPFINKDYLNKDTRKIVEAVAGNPDNNLCVEFVDILNASRVYQRLYHLKRTGRLNVNLMIRRKNKIYLFQKLSQEIKRIGG